MLVSLNRFTLMPETPIAKQLVKNVDNHPRLSVHQFDVHSVTIHHANAKLATKTYYWATYCLMRAVHINESGT